MGKHGCDLDGRAADQLLADGTGDTDDEETENEEGAPDDEAETAESPPSPPAIVQTVRHKPQNATTTT